MLRFLTLVGVIALAASTAKADLSIEELNAAATLTGTESIPIFQTADPAVKTTPNAIKTYINAATAGANSNITSLTGLTTPLSVAQGGTGTGTSTGTGNLVLATAPTVSSLTVTTAFTATGLVTVADLVSSATTVNGQTCTLGSTCTVAAAASTLTGLGTGVATALGNATGATGGLLTFSGAFGTPTSLTLTNATGLPIAGIIGLGTGVGTALAVAVGSAGAPVLFNGAGGTPTSLTLTNATGLPNASVAAAPLPTPGSGATLAGPRSYYECTTTCSVTLPAPAAGYEFCVRNANNVSTVITMAAIPSVQFEVTAWTSYKTANTSIVSGGAVGDRICFLGKDSGHYDVMSFIGTWS